MTLSHTEFSKNTVESRNKVLYIAISIVLKNIFSVKTNYSSTERVLQTIQAENVRLIRQTNLRLHTAVL